MIKYFTFQMNIPAELVRGNTMHYSDVIIAINLTKRTWLIYQIGLPPAVLSWITFEGMGKLINLVRELGAYHTDEIFNKHKKGVLDEKDFIVLNVPRSLDFSNGSTRT